MQLALIATKVVLSGSGASGSQIRVSRVYRFFGEHLGCGVLGRRVLGFMVQGLGLDCGIWGFVCIFQGRRYEEGKLLSEPSEVQRDLVSQRRT